MNNELCPTTLEISQNVIKVGLVVIHIIAVKLKLVLKRIVRDFCLEGWRVFVGVFSSKFVLVVLYNRRKHIGDDILISSIVILEPYEAIRESVVNNLILQFFHLVVELLNLRVLVHSLKGYCDIILTLLVLPILVLLDKLHIVINTIRDVEDRRLEINLVSLVIDIDGFSTRLHHLKFAVLKVFNIKVLGEEDIHYCNNNLLNLYIL